MGLKSRKWYHLIDAEGKNHLKNIFNLRVAKAFFSWEEFQQFTGFQST